MNKKQRYGFTLIELMISIAVMGFISVYVFQTFYLQQRTYVVVEQTSEVQQNGQLVMNLISNDIRMAGFQISDKAALCFHDRTNAPDTLYVSDSDALLAIDDLFLDERTDNLETLVAAAQLKTSATANLSGTTTTNIKMMLPTIDHDAAGVASPSYDVDGNGTLDSDFQPNAGIITYDASETVPGVACAKVSAITPSAVSGSTTFQMDSKVLDDSGSALPISGNITATQFSNVASLFFGAVPAHVYEVVNNQLLRDGFVMADGVEDLQIAYLFDIDEDWIADPGEWRADGIGVTDDFTGVEVDMIRAVRVSLVMQTRTDDPNPAWKQGRRQAIENHVLTGAELAADGRRRRVFTSVIWPRNIGNWMEDN